TAQGGEGIETEELLVFPGFEELLALFKMMEIDEAGEYDVLIVDCAPTGETLSLLKFPEMFEGFMSKIFAMERKVVKTAGPFIEKTIKIPMPEDNVFDDIEKLCDQMAKLKALMMDKERVSIRIVTTPEKIVVKESQRNFSYLHLYDYNVDAVIVNKVYPVKALSGYFNQWIENQEESLSVIQKSFGEIPIFQMPFLKNELRTLERLKTAAEIIYGKTNPINVLAKNKIFTVDQVNGTYFLRIVLPFIDKKDLNLLQKGEELSLTIKNQQRNFILPGKLKNKTVSGATYENGQLNISF
ncbi:MAG: ArsA family ATPase, partial [Eubacterium sp.]